MKKRWISVLMYLAIGQVQAASFDCAKAGTTVEKLICGNSELSKLDDQLAAAYADTLKSPDPASLKAEQKVWLKVRNRCSDVACIQAAYRQRTGALSQASSPLGPALKTKHKLASDSATIECTQLIQLLRLRRTGTAPRGFELEADTNVSGGSNYRGLDIDSDGRTDIVTLSCGASADSVCTLFVDLASGRHIELEEGQMYLVLSHGRVWAIVGDSLSKDMRGKRRAYRIDNEAIRLICNNL